MAIEQIIKTDTTAPTALIPASSVIPSNPASVIAFVNAAEGAFNSITVSTVPNINTVATQLNTFAIEANALAVEVNDNAVLASAAAATAQSTADASSWVSGQAYAVNESAISLIDYQTYRATTATSGTTDPSLSGDWTSVGITPTALDLKANKANPIFTGLITEQVSVSTLTLGATSSVQTYTATADFTIVDDLVDGEFVTYWLTGAGWTCTFPTMTWLDGADGTTEPTLGTLNKIFFEKVGTTLYGTEVGKLA